MARKLTLSRRAPEASNRPSTNVIRLGRQQEFHAVILSPEVTGAEIHWVGRTVPHTTPVDECEGCQKSREIKWEGYVCVWQPDRNAFWILPLNPTCDEQCQSYIEQHGSLRGAEVHAHRTSLKSNAAVQISLHRGERPINMLPSPVNIEKVLMHMWGLNNLDGVELIHAISQEARKPDAPAVPFADTGSAFEDPSVARKNAEAHSRLHDFLPSTNGEGGAA